MKKSILTAIATTCLATGAFAQGSLTGMEGLFHNDGVTTPGANDTNPNLAASGLYFTGTVSLELLYSSTATAGAITALNALDGTANGGAAALSLATSDGFTEVNTTTQNGTTVGPLTFNVSGGDFTGTDPNIVGLVNVPTGGSGDMALYLVDGSSSGLLAWDQSSFGGNPNATPTPGTPASVQQDPAGDNLVLEPTASPEPTTLAFAGLGGLSLLLFRRRS